MTKEDSDEEWEAPKVPHHPPPPTKKKIEKDGLYYIHCTNSSDALIQPNSLEF